MALKATIFKAELQVSDLDRGHFATHAHVARLAVFFPSLVFGWLRARGGGVGAAILFHASCNLYSAWLTDGSYPP